MINETDKIVIKNNDELRYLVDRIHNGPEFAMAFEFADTFLYNSFFSLMSIELEVFEKTYFIYDKEKNLHISEREHGYIWISTMGLVAKSKITKNKYVNSCNSQQIVLVYLLDDAMALCDKEDIYDVDSYNYSMIEQLTPPIFQNVIFYLEVYAKAYLSINKKNVSHTHKLESLLQDVKKAMFECNQNDTLFHAEIIPMFEGMVRHIASIPGNFKEQYVKYDDNPQDITLISFQKEHLIRVREFVELSHDIITEMYYDIGKSRYLHTGLYNRLYKKCKTLEEKNNVKLMYGFLLEKQ